MYIKINSKTHYSVNIDDNHNIYDISDEDLRLIKRRKHPFTLINNALTLSDEPTLINNDYYYTS
jgi:hypothetical protein